MLRCGISGWTYKPWRGHFFPEGLAQKRELEYASRAVNSIEINGSFYSLQRPTSYRTWYEQTPADFLFSVKGPRYITHMLKLRNCDVPLATFFASGPLRLAEKLGPILWQLPPNLGYHRERMESFLGLLPHTHAAAAKLAEKHGDKLKTPAWTKAEHEGRLRHCVEVRHPTFLVPEFITMLRQHRIALVATDSDGRWPYAEDLTSDFAYARLHGAEELYASGYDDQALDHWEDRVRHWSRGAQPKDAHLVTPHPRPHPKIEDVFIYFDNDAKVHAPFDAQRLHQRFAKAKSSPAKKSAS